MEASERQRAPGSSAGPRARRKLARSAIILLQLTCYLCQQQHWAGAASEASSSSSYGNMSALVLSQPASQMTNASLVAGNQNRISAASSSSNSSNSSQQQEQPAGKLAAGKTGRQQPQVVAGSSPANKLKQQAKRPSPEQLMMMMVAADDAHETQAFMPVSNAISVGEGAGPAADSSGAGRPPAGSRQAAAVQPAPAKSSRPAQQAPASSTAAWPPAQATPAPMVVVPPARARASAPASKQTEVQRFFGVGQERVEPPDRPAGYSYAEGHAYTHTSPLSPARQEMQMASERQRQRHSPARQVAAAGSQQVEQLMLEPPGYAEGGRGPLGRAQSAFAGGAMMPAPHLTITGTAASPCRPTSPIQQLQHEVQQTELGVAGSAQALPNFGAGLRYERVAGGTRLRSQHIFKVLRADSLTDCELACTRASLAAGNNPADACRSFNYRAYFAAENCELSRLELHQVKPDDGAQFEQHTQFDFYALPAGASDPLAQQVAVAGSSSSLVYSPFPEADCLDVSQSCSQEGMEFTLRTSEPFTGRIYTYGFYDSCFTDAEGAHSASLRISRSGGFPRCGTQQLGDLMTNIVVVQFNDFVQTTRDKKYNLTCYFSGPGEAVVTSNYLDTKLDERSQPVQIEHLPAQNVITSNVHLRVLYRGQPTNTIAVGDLLTFRLETRAGQQQVRALEPASEIFATNVIAKDPYSGKQVQLIDGRGCPLDPVNVFPELQRTPDGALESEFYAFKIPDSNFLIFQATVRTCRAPCEPVICQAPAAAAAQHQPDRLAQYVAVKGRPQASQAPSWGRRRRRQTEPPEWVDPLAVGESLEHVIPVRLAPADHPLAPVQTLRRPEISEGAEEEVKEMFRVYLSRAEINRQQRAGPSRLQQQQQQQQALMSSKPEWEPERSKLELQEPEVCLSQLGFQVMLFSLIALTLLLCSVLLVATYVTRRAKFRLSDAIADSIF